MRFHFTSTSVIAWTERGCHIHAYCWYEILFCADVKTPRIKRVDLFLLRAENRSQCFLCIDTTTKNSFESTKNTRTAHNLHQNARHIPFTSTPLLICCVLRSFNIKLSKLNTWALFMLQTKDINRKIYDVQHLYITSGFQQAWTCYVFCLNKTLRDIFFP